MKRLAGAAKDATTEEIGWNVERIESRRRSPKKIQEAIEKERTKDDIKMSDDDMDGLEGSLSS